MLQVSIILMLLAEGKREDLLLLMASNINHKHPTLNAHLTDTPSQNFHLQNYHLPQFVHVS